MPLLSRRPIGNGFLSVWQRDESTEQLLSMLVLSPKELEFYNKIAHQPKRRKEWLIWHVMVRTELGSQVYTDYDDLGCPVLVGHPAHISVSHSNNLIVLYSQLEHCGVDIEDCGRNFERVADRYISPEEWQLPGACRNNRFQALMWCIKETAYKYAQIPGLDFIKDIRVQAIDTENSQVKVLLLDSEVVGLKYEFIQGHCLVYTMV